MTTNYLFLVIAGSAVVTWIPRIVPFILSKKVDFPKWLMDFLSYIPICILTALLFQSILEVRTGKLPAIDLLSLVACLPTFLVAIRTKDLMRTVIVGMATMALLRLFF
ncbi:AzlD domain-containing protein [Enterococcus phoeniculicola]|jgi:branched-subunit amino acid transport protein|uniref:Branched-chain amino acid transporter AzlD n=1 Tax=Enterococcus phoeniculicola ATCC BAA-412 TaxID=1158610 RepID=R3WMM0_9ENTE|nr:AzlD domain-containing protein [Enterococcus phoeniculicola]EOL43090.1 hypothetical protein UC3_02067 [Enterococcus phoeniculicola ATCC BAA-412]EOT76552.1 hypothetical protein I589_01509 [Enterococcus phoeniculicola ATCC BAA-412]